METFGDGDFSQLNDIGIAMRILHISDWHGNFHLVPEIISRMNEYDIVIASGDMIPDARGGLLFSENAQRNQIDQPRWCVGNKQYFDLFVGDKPFFYCNGNHDFVSVASYLGAIDITNKLVSIDGFSMYGFPYINYINGTWNYECGLNQMSERVKEIPDCDILVCHAPFAGILDNKLGNASLANLFAYGEKPLPKVVLSGHIHESNGVVVEDGVIFSNAATTYQIIEV